MKKAIALISGGLDSLLAARLIQQQGIHVEGINFYTGFCVEGHTNAIRNRDRSRVKRNNALWVAEQLGIKLHIIDIVDEYKDVVINPKHGYGANLNPCLDCKIFMVHKAYEWIREHGFDFIITGEVVGQRPKSQRKRVMPVIAHESGAEDLLLRPNARAGSSARHCATSAGVRANRKWRWQGNSVSKTMPSRPAVAAFSPTRATRSNCRTCGITAANASMNSTTSCCSRWDAISAPAERSN
jgi:hypothetical protein